MLSMPLKMTVKPVSEFRESYDPVRKMENKHIKMLAQYHDIGGIWSLLKQIPRWKANNKLWCQVVKVLMAVTQDIGILQMMKFSSVVSNANVSESLFHSSSSDSDSERDWLLVTQ